MLVEVAPTSEFTEGQPRLVVVGEREIAVVNVGGGEFFAVDDMCSHALASLSEGEVDVDERTIECPRHGSQFDLSTGRPLSLPATAPVATYRVKVQDDIVSIDVEES